MTPCKGRPLFLGSHWLFHHAVMPAVPRVTVAITVTSSLGEREFSIAFPPGLLTQFVPVVLNVGLLFKPTMVSLQIQVIKLLLFYIYKCIYTHNCYFYFFGLFLVLTSRYSDYETHSNHGVF